MSLPQSWPHMIRSLLSMLLLLLVVVALPGMPTRAAEEQLFQALDDSAADFISGDGVSLQRVAVSNDGGILEGDQQGALLLSPIGHLTPWSQVGVLPTPREGHAVTTLGRRIYAIAGSEISGMGSAQATVFWANVNSRTGAILPAPGLPADQTWRNEPLPASVMLLDENCAGFGDQSGAARTRAGAASLVTAEQPVQVSSGGQTVTLYDAQGLIYVVGGRANLCGANLSIRLVQIGRAAFNGDLVWTSGDATRSYLLPVPVESAGVQTVRRPDGSVYLYVLGGLSTRMSSLGTTGSLLNSVYYTKINPSDGSLEHPLGTAGAGVWATTAPMPLALHEHTTIWSKARSLDGAERDAIYVTGGFTNVGRTTTNARVFLSEVGDQGALSWREKAGLGSGEAGTEEEVSTEGQGRVGAAGFSYGDKIYLLGGRTANSDGSLLASATVASRSDTLQLRRILPDSPEYFIGGSGAQPPVLPQQEPRAYLGVALVPAVAPQPGDGDYVAGQAPNTAWAFALGGRGPNAQPMNTIFRGALGGATESVVAVRAAEGWYFSRYHDVRLRDAADGSLGESRVLAINWSTAINRGATGNPGADLSVEFRSSQLLCSDPFVFAQTTWRQLDGAPAVAAFLAQDGLNTVTLHDAFGSEFDASCFQYRVYFSQNGTDSQGYPRRAENSTETPRLLNLGLVKTYPGSRDLFIERFAITLNAQGQVENVDLRIKNRSPEGAAQTAPSAGVSEFPMVLCIAHSALDQPPPVVEVPLPPLQPDDDYRVDCAPIYRFVAGKALQPDLEVDLTTGWQANYANHPLLPELAQDAPLGDIRSVFSQPGHYAVAAIIDPYGLVDEDGRTTNNRGENLQTEGSGPLILRFRVEEPTVTPPPPGQIIQLIYLPVVVR